MGKMLLCAHRIASVPYYIEQMALNVYSLEELCHYLKQNIDLVEPSFMEEELIDLFYLSVIPTLLGSGTRLFGSLDFELKLKLVRVYSYNGITEMVYKKR